MTDPFFVVGCPRSGTTLLSVLLDRHSRLCIPPETAFYTEIAPQIPFGAERKAAGKVLENWSRLPELELEPEDVLARLPERLHSPGPVLRAILELYAQSHGKVRCGEKTPQHLWHVPTILRQFSRARVICILRDGRDVALSLLAMPWWPLPRLEDAAAHWRHGAGLGAVFARLYPDQFRVVRYEDLIADPATTIRAIVEHIGEQFERTQLDPDIVSGVVLPRSFEWKAQALAKINPNGIKSRLARATPEHVTFLNRFLQTDLRELGYS